LQSFKENAMNVKVIISIGIGLLALLLVIGALLFFRMRSTQNKYDGPPSIVILQRKPHFYDAKELQTAAEKAWGVSFDGGENSKHFVVQEKTVILMKAGPHMISFFQQSRPYGDQGDPKNDVDWLPQESQRRAWAEHAGFTAVDYINKDADAELGYAVISKLAAEMLDDNCTGIFMPREGSLSPNNESLYHDLQTIAASRNTKIAE
jgi:hypothetical protein